MSAAAVCLIAITGAQAQAQPSFRLPKTYPLAIPKAGNVTLTRAVFDLQGKGGAPLPAGVVTHTFLAGSKKLTSPLLLTGAARASRRAGVYHYDAFIALIRRSGSLPGSPRGLGIIVQTFGVAAQNVKISSSSFTSLANALGKNTDASFCRAIAADAAHPSALAFVNPNSQDRPLSRAFRLALARAAAGLCNRGQAAAGAVNAVLGRLGGGKIGAPSSSSGSFSPALAAGTWSGTWKNLTFNTGGTLTLTVSTIAKALSVKTAISGNTFGCAAPAPETFALKQGTGANEWNAAGFRIAKKSPGFGQLDLTYSYPSGAITGGGQNPACAPGLTWKLNGSFTSSTFNATVNISLPGGTAAMSVIKLSRS